MAGEEKTALRTLHRNAQRLLEPVRVVNPFAQHLTFLDDKTRTRRDHKKYLSLIRAIAFLHQHQRPIKTLQKPGMEPLHYVEVTKADIALANRLAHDILGRTLDELPPQTRTLLSLIHSMVKSACEAEQITQADYRFSRRDVREHTGWGNTQIRVHCRRLEELEYLIPHRGKRGQNFVYELAYEGDGQEGSPFLMGLIDVDDLPCDYDGNNAGQKSPLAGATRPQNGAKAAGSRGLEIAPNQDETCGCDPTTENVSEELFMPLKNGDASHINGSI